MIVYQMYIWNKQKYTRKTDVQYSHVVQIPLEGYVKYLFVIHAKY